MRKKLLIILTTLVVLCFSLCGLFACGKDCDHTYSDNFTCHDRVCTKKKCGHVEYASSIHNLDDVFSCHDRTCSDCGETVKATTSHFLSTNVPCKVASCLLCGDTIPASCDHTLESFRKEPDCLTDGFMGQQCSICGYVIGDKLDSYGHDFDSDGNCKNSCGITYNEYYHDEFDVHTYNNDASCKARICTVCGKVVYAQTSHMYVTNGDCADKLCVLCGNVSMGTHEHEIETGAHTCVNNLCKNCEEIVPATTSHVVVGDSCACGYKLATANMTFANSPSGYKLTAYNGTDKNIIIPATYNGSPVVGIADRAFINNDNLVGVSIPKSVKEIGYRAFLGCDNLSNVVFEAGSALNSISDGAFTDCVSLKNIAIPAEVTAISNGAFEGCIALNNVSLPKTLTKIDTNAFKGCTSLTTLIIPETINSLGYSVFADCTSLIAVSFSNAKNLNSLGQNTFLNCSSLSKVVIPESVVHIGANAFANCTSLLDITIPKSVEQLHSTAFTNCKKLVHVKNLSAEPIVMGDFDYELVTNSKTGFNTSINYEENGVITYVKNNVNYVIGYVGDSTELDMSTLTDVEEIYTNAFIGRNFTKVVIPACVKKIGANAFGNCANLNDVQFSGESELTEIGAQAFSGCQMLFTFTLPEKVENIGANAFYNCIRLVNFRNLAGNVQLGSITNNIEFESVTDKTSTFTNKIVKDGDLTLLKAGDKTYLMAYTGVSTTLDLSAKQITNVYSYAFNNNESLQSIILPAALKSVEESAFKGCSSLTEITIPDTVETIGLYSFADCISLTTVNFGVNSALSLISKGAFENCSKMLQFSIPKSVKAIDDRAFYGCENLQTLTFASDSTIESIGKEVFFNCVSLGVLNVPSSVKTIGDYAFYNCKVLAEINFDSDTQIQKIGNYAFSACNGITVLDLGRCNYLYEVGEYAFSNCAKLEDLILPYNVVEIEEQTYYLKVLKDAFLGCSSAKNFYFMGNVEDWIIFDDDDVSNGEFYRKYDDFIDPTVNFYYYSEQQPPQDGNEHWHYDNNGIATPWQQN